jgi:hypothetical protein
MGVALLFCVPLAPALPAPLPSQANAAPPPGRASAPVTATVASGRALLTMVRLLVSG